MAVIRIQKRESPYAVIDRRCLEDTRLSWKARGILAYLLSKPDDWQVSVAALQNAGDQGREGVQNALKELAAHGYAELKNVKGEKGRILGKEWVVRELPTNGFSDGRPNRRSAKPTVGKSDRRQTRSTNKEGDITKEEIEVKNEEASKLAAAPEPQKPASLVHQMRDVFEANHRLHFSPDGQWVGFKWSDKEFGQLKNLSSTLSKRLEDKTQRTPTDAEIITAFDAFLKSAAKDAWHLQNSYMPSKLNGAFQEIVQRAAAPKTDRTAANTSTTAGGPSKPTYQRPTNTW